MIYCVEDDAGIRELVVYTLQNTGLEARGFADGAALFEALRTEKPQLILLDIMLPGEDGHHHPAPAARRAETARLPVILVTAKNTEYDKVIGLDSGADDFIASRWHDGAGRAHPRGAAPLGRRERGRRELARARGGQHLRGRACTHCACGRK